MLTTAAIRAGFSGGIVVDFPNSARAKKYYMVLMVGTVAALPKAKEGEEDGAFAGRDQVGNAKRQNHKGKKRKGATGVVGDGSKRHPDAKGRGWVLKKKEQYRQKGIEVPSDSKYTGRKRPRAF
jgi:18S rRNA (guanine1575-N7)-methyltransferase